MTVLSEKAQGQIPPNLILVCGTWSQLGAAGWNITKNAQGSHT